MFVLAEPIPNGAVQFRAAKRTDKRHNNAENEIKFYN